MIGEAFHGEVVSADASGGVAFKLYKSGEVTEHTLAATEFVNITDYAILSAVAETFGIYADSDAVGRRITKLFAPINGGESRSLLTSHTCPKGVTPKLIAGGAGNVVSIIHGFITGA